LQTADRVLSLLEPKDDHARDVHEVFAKRCTDDRGLQGRERGAAPGGELGRLRVALV
jgi:hypothetical protein